MSIFARSRVSYEANSFDTGVELARGIREAFGNTRLTAILTYSTVNHDQAALLSGLREAAGPGVGILGCSGQGVMSRGAVVEEGYAAGAMGLGGESIDVAIASAEEFRVDSLEKGRTLGRTLLAAAKGPLRAVVLHYDPLCGADVEVLLQGLYQEVRCPIVGGAAAEFWGPMTTTFQYAHNRVLRGAAVAAGLSGAFSVETDICHGTSPVGIEMTVTKADGNMILEFDGRPALPVWQEFCDEAPEHIDHSGAIGIGLPTSDPEVYLVRCAFGVDAERKGVIFQAGIPVGSRVMFNHRTIQGAVDGTQAMAKRLAGRMAGKSVRAVLGFECGARTKPFLGKETTLEENLALQRMFAPHAEWLGMLAWGEVSLFDGKPGFVNFSYPVLALAD
jgi:hypothetical protein